MNSKLKALESLANAINLSEDVRKYVLFTAAKSIAEEICHDLDQKDATTDNDAFGTADSRAKLASLVTNLSAAVMPDKETDAELALRNSRQSIASLLSQLNPSGT